MRISKKQISLLAILFIVITYFGDYTTVPLDFIYLYLVGRFFDKHGRRVKHVFYALCTVVIIEVIAYILLLFIFPAVLGISSEIIANNNWMLSLVYALTVPIYYFLIKTLRLEFSLLSLYLDQTHFKWDYIGIGIVFLFYAYSHLEGILSVVIPGYLPIYYLHQSLFIFLYILILIIMVSYSNYCSKAFLRRKLKAKEQENLANLQEYNTYIEEQYKELRGFKHDYENILLTLRGSLDSKDINQVKEVYQQIVKPSIETISGDVEMCRLEGIEDPIFKGFLSSKMIEAKRLGILFSVDCPYFPEQESQIRHELLVCLSQLLERGFQGKTRFSRSILLQIKQETELHISWQSQGDTPFFDESFSLKSLQDEAKTLTISYQNNQNNHLVIISIKSTIANPR
ncbi:hypothetical protein [Streptococcus saliviloxodontae]|uniref:Histidine kinase n=1 Tax=Streptococcus saliviloxodontae TaxID=1349416 RepID=A0ABS2PJ06_9STRE|nr:hypothetical protein [Streptococcus saliviloxodontae]MBM7635418.1 hypothetical protein [Streptococcus saliviloxodontae]